MSSCDTCNEVRSSGFHTRGRWPELAPVVTKLRVQDESQTWRILYRVDRDAVLILDVFSKKTQVTPNSVIEACRRRSRAYDALNE